MKQKHKINLKGIKLRISDEEFNILKTRRQLDKAFANIQDNNEITSVIESRYKVPWEHILDINRGWKKISFDNLDLEIVGFILKVSTALANEHICIFVISAYSTDHVLVKKENIARAIKSLVNLGCEYEK